MVDLTKAQIGDTVVRMLAGMLPMELNITSIEDGIIHCGPWKFLVSNGAEVDEKLGWDGITKTGSYIVELKPSEEGKKMKVAFDIDGCISEYPQIFRHLSSAAGGHGEIFIITNRDPATRSEIEQELKTHGIYWDHLIITSEKAKAIMEHGINLFFEDTDEYFLDLPPSVCVCKVREPGNFNYDTKKWIYGEKTGEKIK